MCPWSTQMLAWEFCRVDFSVSSSLVAQKKKKAAELQFLSARIMASILMTFSMHHLSWSATMKILMTDFNGFRLKWYPFCNMSKWALHPYYTGHSSFFNTRRHMVVKIILAAPNELHCDKTNKMACAPSKDSDQPGHPPSLIKSLRCPLEESYDP